MNSMDRRREHAGGEVMSRAYVENLARIREIGFRADTQLATRFKKFVYWVVYGDLH